MQFILNEAKINHVVQKTTLVTLYDSSNLLNKKGKEINRKKGC
jgi:hypothetical protein